MCQFFCNFFGLHFPLWAIPFTDPVERCEDGEGGKFGVNVFEFTFFKSKYHDVAKFFFVQVATFDELRAFVV